MVAAVALDARNTEPTMFYATSTETIPSRAGASCEARGACLAVLGALALLVACGTNEEAPSGAGPEDVASDTSDSSDTAVDPAEDVVPDGEDAVDVEPEVVPDAVEDAPADGDGGVDASPCGVSPAGCRATGCAEGEVCWTEFWPGLSCTPSSCSCEAETGAWICTEDCGGGECVRAPGGACRDDADCPFGAQWCEDGVCQECNNDSVLCDIDCGDAGLLVRNGCHPCACAETPECGRAPRTGCNADTDCGPAEECVPHVATVCIPSACACDEESGIWVCTGDCSLGLCRPRSAEPCGTPNPAGCAGPGCDAGFECRTFPAAPCIPSSCVCDEPSRTWACTDDCGGGVCVPSEAWACATDADCVAGATWCEEGLCETCDNSGYVCRIACPEGTALVERNGCRPCACEPVNECVSDGECRPWQRCEPGPECLSWCPVGDPTCCYGNRCVDLPD